MHRRLLNMLLSMLALALFTTGCLVVDRHHGTHNRCTEYATECYETCDVYCDYWGCWEECFPYCSDYCVSYDSRECYRNRDCPGNQVCTDQGYCRDRAAESGNQGLCDVCYYDEDCRDAGALCLVFDDASDLNTGFCGRPCYDSHDCPNEYTCINTDAGGQCVPAVGECSDIGGGFECERSVDCDEGLVCRNHRCVTQQPTCSVHTDCPAGNICLDEVCTPSEQSRCTRTRDCTAEEPTDTCIDGLCRAACTIDDECQLHETCDGSTCVPREAPECVTGSDCGEGAFLCVDGACIAR